MVTTGPSHNLDAKVNNERFATDLVLLVNDWPDDYSIDAGAAAAASVLDEIASIENVE